MASLKTFEEFDALLSRCLGEIEAMLEADPDDDPLVSVHEQLRLLHGWTRGGRQPSQAQKDQLNFGQIASRALDSYPFARSLYRLATFVTRWDEPAPSPSPGSTAT